MKWSSSHKNHTFWRAFLLFSDISKVVYRLHDDISFGHLANLVFTFSSVIWEAQEYDRIYYFLYPEMFKHKDSRKWHRTQLRTFSSMYVHQLYTGWSNYPAFTRYLRLCPAITHNIRPIPSQKRLMYSRIQTHWMRLVRFVYLPKLRPSQSIMTSSSASAVLRCTVFVQIVWCIDTASQIIYFGNRSATGRPVFRQKTPAVGTDIEGIHITLRAVFERTVGWPRSGRRPSNNFA